MKQTWQTWLGISKKVVGIQASFFFGLIFIVIITPLSYIIRKVNPSIFKGSNVKDLENTYWNKIKKTTHNLEFARRQ